MTRLSRNLRAILQGDPVAVTDTLAVRVGDDRLRNPSGLGRTAPDDPVPLERRGETVNPEISTSLIHLVHTRECAK